jgi:hypothetical protein
MHDAVLAHMNFSAHAESKKASFAQPSRLPSQSRACPASHALVLLCPVSAMCFTQPVSIGFAVSMWLFAAVWRGPGAARACIAYFAAMETLQAFQYSWINQCDDPINKVRFFSLSLSPLRSRLLPNSPPVSAPTTD